MCPAAGQGALAIETRDDGGAAYEIARKLDHAATNAAVTAERSLLATFEGGCQVPIGAHGTLRRADAASDRDGGFAGWRARDARRALRDGDPAALGRELGDRMLAAGARDILEHESRRPRRFIWSAPGPGDPGLITVKGRKILERADSILYDHLASERLLDLAPALPSGSMSARSARRMKPRRKRSPPC